VIRRHVIASRLINFFFPSRCPSCCQETDTIACAPFCADCWEGIESYSGPSCAICSTPFASAHATTCASCRTEPPFFTHAETFGLYEGVLAMAINRLKFHGIRRLARPLGQLLASCAAPPADVVVCVPLSLRSLRERGFNQAHHLAKCVSETTGIPLVADGLVKDRDTHPQIGLSARQRRTNLKGAFTAVKHFAGLRVVLVDDVMTTGATLNECARVLVKAGAQEVFVLALARANSI
jgi:ComF family protein